MAGWKNKELSLSSLSSTVAGWITLANGKEMPAHGAIAVDPVTGLPLDMSSPVAVKTMSGDLFSQTLSANGDFSPVDLSGFDHAEFAVSTTGSGVSFVISAAVSFDGGNTYHPEPIETLRFDSPSQRAPVDIADRAGLFAANGRGGLLKLTLASLAGSGSPTVTVSGRPSRQPMPVLRDMANALVMQPYAPQWADFGEPLCVDLTNANAGSGNGYAIAAGAGAGSNLATALASVSISGQATTTAVSLSILAGAVVIWKINLPAGVFDKHIAFPRLLTSASGGSLNVKLSGDPTGAITFACQPFRVRK